MVTAAKTLSQVCTHTGIAFAIAYCLTGSIAFGGLAAVLEPLINVAALPLHERLWSRIRSRLSDAHIRSSILTATQKLSQTSMHMGIAFGVMFWATGSLAFGGMAAILEPVCNVMLLPFHNHAWEKLRSRIHVRARHPLIVF